MSNAFHRLMTAAVALALFTAIGCDNGEEAQTEIGRLTAETNEVRGKLDAAAQEAAGLRTELQQLKDQNAALQTERDALRKRVDKLQAAARPAPSESPATAQAPPAPREEDKSLRDARERMESLASALFAREQYDLAGSVAQAAVQLGSKRAEPHFQIAYGSAGAAEYAAAAKEYERAIAALEGQPDADQTLLKKCLNNWGAAAARLGDADKAEKLYLRVLTLDPAFAPASFNLGLLYAGQPKRAADAVRALQDYVVRGGSRATSARELILKLQPPQEAPAVPPAH